MEILKYNHEIRWTLPIKSTIWLCVLQFSFYNQFRIILHMPSTPRPDCYESAMNGEHCKGAREGGKRSRQEASFLRRNSSGS